MQSPTLEFLLFGNDSPSHMAALLLGDEFDGVASDTGTAAYESDQGDAMLRTSERLSDTPPAAVVDTPPADALDEAITSIMYMVVERMTRLYCDFYAMTINRIPAALRHTQPLASGATVPVNFVNAFALEDRLHCIQACGNYVDRMIMTANFATRFYGETTPAASISVLERRFAAFYRVRKYCLKHVVCLTDALERLLNEVPGIEAAAGPQIRSVVAYVREMTRVARERHGRMASPSHRMANPNRYRVTVTNIVARHMPPNWIGLINDSVAVHTQLQDCVDYHIIATIRGAVRFV